MTYDELVAQRQGYSHASVDVESLQEALRQNAQGIINSVGVKYVPPMEDIKNKFVELQNFRTVDYEEMKPRYFHNANNMTGAMYADILKKAQHVINAYTGTSMYSSQHTQVEFQGNKYSIPNDKVSEFFELRKNYEQGKRHTSHIGVNFIDVPVETKIQSGGSNVFVGQLPDNTHVPTPEPVKPARKINHDIEDLVIPKEKYKHNILNIFKRK